MNSIRLLIIVVILNAKVESFTKLVIKVKMKTEQDIHNSNHNSSHNIRHIMTYITYFKVIMTYIKLVILFQDLG